MRTLTIALSIAGLALCSNLKAQGLKTKQDSISYSIGVMMAQNLKQQNIENLDPAIFAKAVDDVLKNGNLQIAAPQATKIGQEFMKAQQAKKYEKTMAEGKKFLEENAKRPGVTTLPSGLQYEVLKAGTGPKPAKTDKVSVHYHGTLIDGTIFDSSVDRGQPATFGVTQVIAGWVEALQLMQTGSKWKLAIPYNLAYGERGAGPKIGPYSTLIFEVELLDIVK
ncbi:MAG: FKBP-type peptidyl-prolyl cis-trans isomerase [Saprospiraceae bacterium]|nr:FKBP-type peptidyl-prolyl cis-trans isomerase [Saprospiraceae bacterium]